MCRMRLKYLVWDEWTYLISVIFFSSCSFFFFLFFLFVWTRSEAALRNARGSFIILNVFFWKFPILLYVISLDLIIHKPLNFLSELIRVTSLALSWI